MVEALKPRLCRAGHHGDDGDWGGVPQRGCWDGKHLPMS